MKEIISKELLIIGAGPAGLKAAEEAERYGLDYLVLDSGQVGQAWRDIRPEMPMLSPCHPQRDWTSLSYKFPIWKMDIERPYCTAVEFAAYLQAYADHFKLKISENSNVTSIQYDDGVYHVNTDSDQALTSRIVFIATGVFGNPFIPALPGVQGNPNVIHSKQFMSPADFDKQRVLVIGAGNSAAEIATELAGNSMVYLAHRRELHFFSDTHRLHDIRGISESYLKELIKMEIIRHYSYHTILEIDGNRAIFKDRVLEVDKFIFATGYQPVLNLLDLLGHRKNQDFSPEINMSGESIQYPGLFFGGPLANQAPSGVVIHGFIRKLVSTIQRIQERIRNRPETEVLNMKQEII